MIKFRAWDKENEIYLYNVQYAYDKLGGFVKYDDGKDAEYDESCFGDFLDNKRYDIEQFTGLTDTSGKDIYEGDIVEVTSQYWGTLGNRYEVKFKQGAFCVKYGLLSEISPSISVIGNVHENPELLEEDK
ncbi:YopX family protein [Lactiplantibacillus plantarum]|uniref:YopX family protein n=1 Tax=Lactiplantibacillus plantarum TaxID=1590 RepID=UPI00338DF76D